MRETHALVRIVGGKRQAFRLVVIDDDLRTRGPPVPHARHSSHTRRRAVPNRSGQDARASDREQEEAHESSILDREKEGAGLKGWSSCSDSEADTKRTLRTADADMQPDCFEDMFERTWQDR